MKVRSLDVLEHLDCLLRESLGCAEVPGTRQELRTDTSPDRLRLDVVGVREFLGRSRQVERLLIAALGADRTREQSSDERQQVLLTHRGELLEVDSQFALRRLWISGEHLHAARVK